MESRALSPLAVALARTAFADDWYRWCNATRDWAAEATGAYDVDSLLTERGSYAALEASEFQAAFREAGGAVSKGSTFPGPRHRSFTVVAPADGAARCSLAIRLGRGLNSLECSLAVLVGDQQVGEAELLHVLARSLRRARGGDAPDTGAPYPRPVIGSRSQLEVVAGQLVRVLQDVARDWDAA